MSKINAPTSQIKYYNFLKFKNLNRNNSIFFFYILKHIKNFCLKYNMLVLNMTLKFNFIYCYVHYITYSNNTNSLNFKAYPFLNQFVTVSFMFNQFILFFWLTILKTNFIVLQLNFFKYYFLRLKHQIFNICNVTKKIKITRLKIFRSKTKTKLLKNFLYLKNFKILLTFFLKNNYLLYNQILIIKNIFSNIYLNGFWFQTNTKKVFFFKKKLYPLLIISYLTEIIQNSNLFLDYILYYIKQQKLQINKQFNYHVINQLKNQLLFLISYKLIYFFGFCLYLTGKLGKSMRSAKTSLKYGNISTQSKKTLISLSYDTIVTRAGVISFKLWIHF